MDIEADETNKFNITDFYRLLIRPVVLDSNHLLANKNQVAGHTGFYSLCCEPDLCLKPFNTKCVRGRREHLFYQLLEYHKRKLNNQLSSTPSNLDSEARNANKPLYYKDFTLLTYPSPPAKCNCTIDESLFELLSSYVANFYHVKHLSNRKVIEGDHGSSKTNPQELNQFLDSVYSDQLTCPCYGRDPKEKSSCSRDYEKVDFLCLQDLTAHCREPCIIDIKIGQITYDPMAIKEKVLEQSSKYIRLREFGFRILGMKLGSVIKDKNFGKALETTEQVSEALDSFFIPLDNDSYKYAVLERILERIQALLVWFETKNIDQLRFFSSSLLIVYDSFIEDQHSRSIEAIQGDLSNSVRVSMIDFAHVFHVHDDSKAKFSNANIIGSGVKDTNYIFGLRKLEQLFSRLSQNYRSANFNRCNPKD